MRYRNNLPVGNYLPNIQKQLQSIRDNGTISGRKINAFYRAMAGDSEAVIVDIWALRAFGLDRQTLRHTGPHKGKLRSGGATDKQYTMIETYIREQAPQMGLLPCEMSAMIWAGARTFHNGEFENSYEAILRYEMNNLFGCI